MWINGSHKSESFYDGTGARRFHSSTIGGRREKVAYAGQELTLRNESELTHHIFADGERIASRVAGNNYDVRQAWREAPSLALGKRRAKANREVTWG